jgi:acyl dehydratase
MDPNELSVGETTGGFGMYVDPDNVIAYALASNDENSMYLDGRAVPPLFAVVVALPALQAIMPALSSATAGARGAVHGEHDLRVTRPMRPGTWVTTVARVRGGSSSRAGLNVVIDLRTEDEQGPLVEQHWSVLFLGSSVDGAVGSLAPDHSFPENSRCRPVGSMTLPTTRDQTFRYAGASGDRAPMHVDDHAAQAMGFPRKFNQGLGSLAVAAKALVDIAAGSNPLRVRRLAVRFGAIAYPGDPIRVSIFAARETPEGDSAFSFEAASMGKPAFKHGRIEVAPAEVR